MGVWKTESVPLCSALCMITIIQGRRENGDIVDGSVYIYHWPFSLQLQVATFESRAKRDDPGPFSLPAFGHCLVCSPDFSGISRDKGDEILSLWDFLSGNQPDRACMADFFLLLLQKSALSEASDASVWSFDLQLSHVSDK